MPGQNPGPPPEESAEERDARTAAQNEQRDAMRRELLDLQEQVNAVRVHLAHDATDLAEGLKTAARATERFVPAPADDEAKGE